MSEPQIQPAPSPDPDTTPEVSPDVLPLTKGLAPEDYAHFTTELPVVERLFRTLSEQHPQRRWEYALAAYAFGRWVRSGRARPASSLDPWQVLDVGGAGSPLGAVLTELHHGATAVEVVDPVLNCAIESALIAPASQDAVFCTSVLEHVAQHLTVLRACIRALKPGGLLFLTVDYSDADGPDVYQFSWMRRRIYTPTTWQKLYRQLRELGMTRFGGCDWRPHGAQVYNYTFASLCMVRGALPEEKQPR